MVSQKKIQEVKKLSEEIKKYSVIGIIDMHKLPARQLHEIRDKLRGKAVIKMTKKVVIERAFKKAGLEGLAKYITGQPALLFSKENPFKLARLIQESKSKAPAKPGDRAPNDIVVKAGPTSLPPGPVIGELQRAKIPATVEGDKISVKQDTVVAKKGEIIERHLADILGKLGIEPMEIGLSVKAVWENGTIYREDVLFIPPEEYAERLKTAYSNALNLSINIGFFTKDNIHFILSSAHSKAVSLALSAGIVTKETIACMLFKAHAEAMHLKEKLKIDESHDKKEKEE